ncbi:AraC family transcriptional regulator [Clostridium sp.]
MANSMEMSIDELCPYIRKAGTQARYLGNSTSRKIYDYEMMYCVYGNAQILINGEEFTMSEGSLITIPPNTVHRFWVEAYNMPLIYWVHFDFLYRMDVNNLEKLVTNHNDVLYMDKLIDENYIRQSVKFEEGFLLPYYLNLDNHSVMKGYFKLLVDSYEKHGNLWQIESKILLLQIFEQVFLNLYRKGLVEPVKNKNIQDVITKYIMKNYNRKVTISEIANFVGLSEDHLGKVFKKNTGSTIIEFVNKHRISKAKELLTDKDLSIESISEMVGFSDGYYFSRVMKKYEGVSPKIWREKYRTTK